MLALDADQPLIMQNRDQLVATPRLELAVLRASWFGEHFFASVFLMVNLSDLLRRTVKTALDSVEYGKFDVDRIDGLLGDTVMVLNGEYVTLNSHWKDWDLPK